MTTITCRDLEAVREEFTRYAVEVEKFHPITFARMLEKHNIINRLFVAARRARCVYGYENITGRAHPWANKQEREFKELGDFVRCYCGCELSEEYGRISIQRKNINGGYTVLYNIRG